MSTAVALVDAETGEIVQVEPPQNLDEVNRRINAFVHYLGALSKELHGKSNQLLVVQTAYKPYRYGLIAASTAGEAEQRKADAEIQLFQTPAIDLISGEIREKYHVEFEPNESIAAAKDRLDHEVKTLKARCHDYRAAMVSLQSIGSNIRTEMETLGAMPS